jgi:hypothetical protein
LKAVEKFRNNIHGRMIPGSEAPAIEAFTLFEKYAILASEYLGRDGEDDEVTTTDR